MFLTLLAVTLVTSFVVSFFIASLFRKPIAQILAHTVAHESSTAWARFVLFTIFVVGASGGVEIYRLEQYINPRRQEMEPLVLNSERWIFEVYQTVIGAMESIAWMLSIFFIITLIGNVAVRVFEARRLDKTAGEQTTDTT